ncbi:hypothetical protein MYK68_08170 [Gordonia sp. PP30]|uniref:hypothetical protein n=1 Tax=unclassified Gordonia (in: high G+C Gram-positive bacteria) TaxID=2657482 RepID=UPI0020001369|nr:hypothetical protein [Gordonia sp. PP30]UQE76528.1 hypothetical protein MYK68_08170 [Gordonia sp. PP30]
MGDVESIEDVWRDRARVASEAADELEDLANQLESILTRNAFGIGCVEGEVLFERLGQIRNAAVDAFRARSGEARQLSERCLTAAAVYTAADESSAVELGASG